MVHPNSLPRVTILLGNIPTQARCMNSDAFEILHITLVAICHQCTNQNQVDNQINATLDAPTKNNNENEINVTNLYTKDMNPSF